MYIPYAITLIVGSLPAFWRAERRNSVSVWLEFQRTESEIFRFSRAKKEDFPKWDYSQWDHWVSRSGNLESFESFKKGIILESEDCDRVRVQNWGLTCPIVKFLFVKLKVDFECCIIGLNNDPRGSDSERIPGVRGSLPVPLRGDGEQLWRHLHRRTGDHRAEREHRHHVGPLQHGQQPGLPHRVQGPRDRLSRPFDLQQLCHQGLQLPHRGRGGSLLRPQALQLHEQPPDLHLRDQQGRRVLLRRFPGAEGEPKLGHDRRGHGDRGDLVRDIRAAQNGRDGDDAGHGDDGSSGSRATADSRSIHLTSL